MPKTPITFEARDATHAAAIRRIAQEHGVHPTDMQSSDETDDVRAELDHLADSWARQVEHAPWLPMCRGIYAGWDGRFVKLGVAGGQGGLAVRLKSYLTHNPSFRVVGFAPAARDKVSSYAELEAEVQRLCGDLVDYAVDATARRRPSADEWFRPTLKVFESVCDLYVATVEASAAGTDWSKRFLYAIEGRGAGQQKRDDR